MDHGAEGARDSTVSSRSALSGYAFPSESKAGGPLGLAGVTAETAISSHSETAVASAPGQAVPPMAQNRTGVKPTVPSSHSRPEEEAPFLGSMAHPDAPQHKSVQAVPATGETPAPTPPASIPQPAPDMSKGMSKGVSPNATPSGGTAGRTPGAKTAPSDSSRLRPLADRRTASDTAVPASALRPDISFAQLPSDMPLVPPPAIAPELSSTGPAASGLAAPLSLPRPTTGGDQSSLVGLQHESALRTESSARAARLAGLQFSPASAAAASVPLAFQMRLTTPGLASTAGSPAATEISAPASSLGPIAAPHREANPHAAVAAVADDPVRASSTGGQMPEPGADRGRPVGEAPLANRPETSSDSRGGSRAEPIETAAGPAKALTTDPGALSVPVSAAEPPLRPSAQPVTEHSQISIQPPVELAPPAPAASPVHRDIQLQIGSGPSGVAVRVAERAGEIRVDVRTPDSQLTSTLRQELPTLAARLTESGFNAAAWHPASASGPALSRDAAQTSAQTGADDQGGHGQGQPRQQSGRQPPDERPQQSSGSPPTNTNRKDFQWLFTSLQ